MGTSPYSPAILSDVDPFIGTAATRLPTPSGLATKEEPDFVETFGIALTEKLLTGGGPVITTLTGGTGEAVGDTAVIVPAGDVAALTAALDRVVLEMSEQERDDLARRGCAHALAFDRVRVFDDLFRTGAPVVPAVRPATRAPLLLPEEPAPSAV